MIYDVDIAGVPAQAVLSLRRRGPVSGIGDAMRRLRGLMKDAGFEAAGPMAARFYDEGATDEDAEYDVALPVVPRAEVYEVTSADGVPPDRYVTRVRLPYAR